MKVVDFIRKFGWEISKAFLDNWSSLSEDYGFKVDDLKTYVDAWELVQKMGGMDSCKSMVQLSGHKYLKQAIEIVESVK